MYLDQQAYAPPRKYRDLIRKGKPYESYADHLGRVSGGTTPSGLDPSYRYDAGLALRLTEVLVQQGWDDARITAEHLRWRNKGFVWVQEQDDPLAASAALIAQCDRDKKPMIPTKHRHARILALLRTGEVVSEKRAVQFVGTARDSDTRNDLAELERAGAITVELEQHGKRTWKRISLAVPVAMFWEISYAIRYALSRLIARMKAKRKGCKRLPVGKARKPMKEATNHEIKEEQRVLNEERLTEAVFGETPRLDLPTSTNLQANGLGYRGWISQPDSCDEDPSIDLETMLEIVSELAGRDAEAVRHPNCADCDRNLLPPCAARRALLPAQKITRTLTPSFGRKTYFTAH